MFQPLSLMYSESRQENWSSPKPKSDSIARAMVRGSWLVRSSVSVTWPPESWLGTDCFTGSTSVRRSEREGATVRPERSSEEAARSWLWPSWLWSSEAPASAAEAALPGPSAFITMPEETAMPVAATATPENNTDLRMPFLRAGSLRGPRCFGTYVSRRGTGELTNVDNSGRCRANPLNARRSDYLARFDRQAQTKQRCVGDDGSHTVTDETGVTCVTSVGGQPGRGGRREASFRVEIVAREENVVPLGQCHMRAR